MVSSGLQRSYFKCSTTFMTSYPVKIRTGDGASDYFIIFFELREPAARTKKRVVLMSSVEKFK